MNNSKLPKTLILLLILNWISCPLFIFKQIVRKFLMTKQQALTKFFNFYLRLEVSVCLSKFCCEHIEGTYSYSPNEPKQPCKSPVTVIAAAPHFHTSQQTELPVADTSTANQLKLNVYQTVEDHVRSSKNASATKHILVE